MDKRMEVLKNVETLEQSTEFKEWKKTHKNSYLVHIFKMLDEANKNIWQLGYYNKSNDTITTFFIENENITLAPESKVFKEDKNVIQELDLEKATVEFGTVIKTANQFQQEHHQGDLPTKTIAILQHLEIGQVWNVTFVTKTFKTLNVKIDSVTGDIVKHSLTSIFDFKM